MFWEAAPWRWARVVPSSAGLKQSLSSCTAGPLKMKEGNRVLETSEITHPRTQCHFPKYLNRQQHRCANLTYRKTNRVDTVTTYRAAAHSQCQSTARRRVTKICECRDVNGQSPMCSAWWHWAPWQLACGRVTARQVVTGRHNNPLSSFEQETFWA